MRKSKVIDMPEEEEKPLEERLRKAVNDCLEEEGDRAYFLVDMKLFVYADIFYHGRKKILFDEFKERFGECAFCGEKTMYRFDKRDIEYLCAGCYNKMTKKEG